VQFLAATASGLTALFVSSGMTKTVLPKFYTMAAMWTLNSHKGIHSTATNEPPTHLDLRTTLLGGTSGSQYGGEAQMNGSERTKLFIEVKTIEWTPV
jgi:hypothetical protein